jgi:hypothetical protein
MIAIRTYETSYGILKCAVPREAVYNRIIASTHNERRSNLTATQILNESYKQQEAGNYTTRTSEDGK